MQASQQQIPGAHEISESAELSSAGRSREHAADDKDEKPAIRAGDRALASLAYIGIVPFIIIASRPGPEFIRRHLRRAAVIQLTRIFWMGAIAVAWWVWFADGETTLRAKSLVNDLAAIVLIGTPLPSTYTTGALPWILTPVVMTWAASLVGFGLAVSGHSADFRAFANADWSDPTNRRRFLYRPVDQEREVARRARNRQLERLQKTSDLMRSERTRQDEITDLNEQIERLDVQRDYHKQLFALGEITERRYDLTNEELDEKAHQLKTRLSEVKTRIAIPYTKVPDRLRVNRLDRPEETLIETMAIVTPAGIPVYAYGHFQIDEVLVAGMMSAFDSLSEEVFGSRVHKTMLAEGQVLYFAHGEHILIMAIFVDEPAPRQIEQLRTMLRQFEQANQGPLSREQYDPDYLHEVPIPFRFVDEPSLNKIAG